MCYAVWTHGDLARENLPLCLFIRWGNRDKEVELTFPTIQRTAHRKARTWVCNSGAWICAYVILQLLLNRSFWIIILHLLSFHYLSWRLLRCLPCCKGTDAEVSLHPGTRMHPDFSQNSAPEWLGALGRETRQCLAHIEDSDLYHTSWWTTASSPPCHSPSPTGLTQETPKYLEDSDLIGLECGPTIISS